MRDAEVEVHEIVKIFAQASHVRKRLQRRRRDFRSGKLEDKAGTDGRIVFDAEDAIVFGDDAGGYSKTESSATVLCGKVWKKKFVLIGRGDALAGVFNGDFDGLGFGVEARGDRDLANGRRFQSFGRVVDEIYENATQKACVCSDGWKRIRKGAGEEDAVHAAGKNFEGFANDLVDAGRLEFGGREANKLREFVDERGERPDFAFD